MKKEYSKKLLDQESALIWIMSLSFIVLAFYCIYEGFTGSLPWLAAMVGFPWTAYGVSQAMYYRKSMKENTAGGIKYDSVMEEIRQAAKTYNDVADSVDYSMYEDGTDPYAEYSESNDESYEATENVDEY
jgi:hypothetical protein